MSEEKDIPTGQGAVAGAELFAAYPELRAHLKGLCAGRSWGLTGVSALLHDTEALYLEITKPKHWRRAHGLLLGGLGAIGGSLEPGETVLGCLARELHEEVGTAAAVESAARVSFVYEQERVSTVGLAPCEYPLPVLFTVSRNIHRRRTLPEAEVLAIVTFWARPMCTPALRDLLALVRVPWANVPQILAARWVAAGDLASRPGVELHSREPLPKELRLYPVWTIRSLQRLWRTGHLSLDDRPQKRTDGPRPW